MPVSNSTTFNRSTGNRLSSDRTVPSTPILGTVVHTLDPVLDPEMDPALVPDAPAIARLVMDLPDSPAALLIAERAKRAEDWMRKAALQAEQTDYVAAIDFYSQAIETDPSCARAYGNRGLLKGNLGNRVGAIADLRQAAQIFHARSMTGNYEMVLAYIKRLSL
jgi:tetratricopeptide (TPR) repeat protein